LTSNDLAKGTVINLAFGKIAKSTAFYYYDFTPTVWQTGYS